MTGTPASAIFSNPPRKIALITLSASFPLGNPMMESAVRAVHRPSRQHKALPDLARPVQHLDPALPILKHRTLVFAKRDDRRLSAFRFPIDRVISASNSESLPGKAGGFPIGL